MLDPNFNRHFQDIGFIVSSLKGGSLLGIFLLSLFVSYVIPLPEVVLLLFVGFVAKTSHLNVIALLAVCMAGIIVGDNVLYRLSFFGNKYVERFNEKMRKNKLIQYEHLVADNIGKAIFFLRFITGVRFFGPVVSGTLGVKWRKFFLYNASATAVHTALFVYLGYSYRHGIFRIITEVEIIRNILLFSSALIVGLLVKIFNLKSKN